jgi:hypothetical protein
MIFNQYFYGWFTVDFVSILPLEVVLLAIAENSASEDDAAGDA